MGEAAVMADKPKKLSPARLAQKFNEAAEEFERSRHDNEKRLRRLAFAVAGAGGLIGVLGVATALVAVMMRTEPEPVVLHTNDRTGMTTMLRSLRDGKDRYDEVTNKFWLKQYVMACEGYDWFLVADSLAACKLMSSDALAKEQETRVRAPDAPLKLLKDKGRVRVTVDAITFVGDSAQIHFRSVKQNASGENVDGSPPQRWISTAAFEFKPETMLSEQQRLVNPLGLKVQAYRRDQEALQ